MKSAKIGEKGENRDLGFLNSESNFILCFAARIRQSLNVADSAVICFFTIKKTGE